MRGIRRRGLITLIGGSGMADGGGGGSKYPVPVVALLSDALPSESKDRGRRGLLGSGRFGFFLCLAVPRIDQHEPRVAAVEIRIET
jgi:hypothetical protein